MARNRLFSQAHDAPPGTARAIREMQDRLYEIQDKQDSKASTDLATDKGLGSTVQNLSGQVSDLKSRYALTDIGTYVANSGSTPSTNTFFNVGKEMSTTIVVPGPEKQLQVTWGAAEISVDNPASNAFVAEVSMRFSGGSYGTYNARIYLNTQLRIGLPVVATQAFSLAKGTYVLQAQCRVWSATGGTGTASANFTAPYITTQIIGAS